MDYQEAAFREMALWRKEMTRNPSFVNRISKKVQTKLNGYIPEKIHKAITAAIKQMVRGVILGAKYTSRATMKIETLQKTEDEVKRIVKTYRTTAAAEGGITGAGGILLGLADFPILLGIKMKMLFDIASIYGFDVMDYKERLYILYIFQLAFSSQQYRREIFEQIQNWDREKKQLPDDINAFDWRNFQQEYRDYIDLAKMAQLIPGIGAAVGVLVNYKLMKQLGRTAMNAYRMRLYSK